MSHSPPPAMDFPGRRAALNEAHLLEVFNLFAKNNVVTTQDLRVIVKSFHGCSMTEDEMHAIEKASAEGGGSSSKTFEEVKEILEPKVKKMPYVDYLKEAFGLLEDGGGAIGIGELRHYIRLSGEKLSEEEIDQIVAYADADKDEKINCECGPLSVKQRRPSPLTYTPTQHPRLRRR